MKHSVYILLLLSVLVVSCQKDGIPASIDVDFEMNATDAYTGDLIQFNALTAGVVARYDWFFEGGTPETSPLSSPEVTWLTAGNYTVTLTVSNKNGSAVATKKKVITIDYTRSIIADFSVDRATATNEEYVQFTDLSTGCPVSYLWTFTSDTGHRVTSTDKNPRIKLEPGKYTVTLKAYNPLTSDTKVKSAILVIIDKDAVDAAFTQDKYFIVEGGNVRFSDKSLGKVETWAWEFEGGTPATSTEPAPTVTYSTAGDYQVKLTVSNSLSESSITLTNRVNVLSKDKLVVFLPFDNSLNDVGPNAFHATSYSLGGASNSYVQGHNDRSVAGIYLPGGNKTKSSLIQLPADRWQGICGYGSNITISMWVKLDRLDAQTGFFAMGSCPGVLEQGNNQIWARMQISDGVMRMLVESYQNGQSNDIKVENVWGGDGKWHHYAFVYKVADKCSAYLYIDGALVGSALNKGVKLVDTKPFYIGGNMSYSSGVWTPSSCMDGYVDDFIIYAKALEASDIVKLSKY